MLFNKIIFFAILIIYVNTNPLDRININFGLNHENKVYQIQSNSDSKPENKAEVYSYDNLYQDYWNDDPGSDYEDNGGCIEESGIQYTDYDISSKHTSSVQECADWCGETHLCNVWSLDKLDNTCLIKTKIHMKKENPLVVSGSKSCGQVIKCGKTPLKNRIIGGRRVRPNEFPWITSIVFHKPSTHKTALDEKHCGGTLISKDWVLTAAHCLRDTYVDKPGQIYLTLGEHDRTRDTTHTFKTTAAQYVINPYYETFTGNNIQDETNYDIALVRLKEPVNWNLYPNIRPACLPDLERQYLDHKKYWHKKGKIMGWGITSHGTNSAILLRANLLIYNNTYCDSLLDETEPVGPFKICAGAKRHTKKGSTDTCQNDSGGPLIHLTKSKDHRRLAWQIIGVVSYGSGPLQEGQCGKVGIYVKVSMHLKWIYATMDNYMIHTGTVKEFTDDESGARTELIDSTISLKQEKDSQPPEIMTDSQPPQIMTNSEIMAKLRAASLSGMF